MTKGKSEVAPGTGPGYRKFAPNRNTHYSHSSIVTESSDAADRAAIAAVRDRWATAVAQRAPSMLRPLLTDDYEVWAHAAEPLRGADGAVAAMAAAVERFDIVQRFDPVETVV